MAAANLTSSASNNPSGPPNASGRRVFDGALRNYQRARRAAEMRIDKAHDMAIGNVDAALDAFMATPSPTPRAFGEKLKILEAEYGSDAQPRHIAAIYADARSLT